MRMANSAPGIALTQVMEEKINANNVEIASVSNGQFLIYDTAKLQTVIDRL